MTAPLRKADSDRVFHALGDATRRAMLETLGAGPATVSSLAKPHRMTFAAVVQHVQVLEKSGLIATKKVGRVRTCQLNSAGLSVAERWLNDRRTMWEKRFDRLGDLLAEEE